MRLVVWSAIGGLAASIVALSACNSTDSGEGATPQAEAGYQPEARYPAGLQTPHSVEDIMPFARAVSRNKSNIIGLGLGEVNDGEKILLVTTSYGEDMLMFTEAVVRALKERNVEATLVHDYDILGISREEAELYVNWLTGDRTTGDGWVEGCRVVPKAYLKSAREDLYEKCYAGEDQELPEDIKAIMVKLGLDVTGNRPTRGLGGDAKIVDWINDYLDAHPDYRGVFWGRGGPIWMKFTPNETRWMGLFVQDNKNDVMAPNATYPADVWLLTEELAMEPMASVDRVEVTDLEGTDVYWEMTETQSQNWARGVYLRGHLFVFPQEAYGQYGLSVVNYPALDPQYIPVDDSVLINGKIVATKSHAGFFVPMTETWKDGTLVSVEGGGTYGELLRTLMEQPGINTTVYPQRTRPGYFQFFETAFGTNPKIIRNNLKAPWGILPERGRSAAIHWALGAIYWNDPGSGGGMSEENGLLKKFGEETGLPYSHGFHMHTYFNTMKFHLRGSDKWVTISDKGRLTALDNPEVRALASRYGDPDEILAEEWIEDIPGVSTPGDYSEYAKDPYGYSLSVQKKIDDGTYEYFWPRQNAGE